MLHHDLHYIRTSIVYTPFILVGNRTKRVFARTWQYDIILCTIKINIIIMIF